MKNIEFGGQPLLDLGVIVATYPGSPCADVLMPNGDRLSNVPVMVEHGSDSSGHIDLPDIGNPPGDARWQVTQQPERYVRGIISFIRGIPLCLGFVYPQNNQIGFNQLNRKIDRHASDVYSTIDQFGNTEWAHPSGTYVRVGTNSAHEDLSNQNYQQNWKIAKNTGTAVHMRVQVANAGVVVASLDIDPGGNVTLTHNGNLKVNTQGNAQVTVQGTTTVDSTGAATVKAPMVEVDSPQSTFTGAVTVQGLLTFNAGATGKAGSGGGLAMMIDGDAHATGTVTGDTDVVAAGVSGKGHKHPGVQEGGDETDPPTVG